MKRLVFLLLLIPIFCYAQKFGRNNRRGITLPLYTNAVPITLTFASNPSSVTLSKAPVMYDKNWIYSITFDDTYRSAYINAYPVLNGGADTNGTVHPQLYFTDGCGNNIPFTASIGWYTIHSATGLDMHTTDASYLTYAMGDTLYAHKWDLINHSWDHQNQFTSDHCTYGFCPASAPNYDYEISQGASAMAAGLGVAVQKLFIIPAGDTNYYSHCNKAGYYAVFNQSSAITWQGSPGFGFPGIRVDTYLNRHPFTFYRQLLDNGGGGTTYPAMTANIDSCAHMSNNTGKHYWFNDYTHYVVNGPVATSLTLSVFIQYMTYIYNTYGAGGSDNVWFVGLQTAYDFLRFKEDAELSTPVISSNTASFTLYHPYSDNSILKTAQLTIKINTNQDITSVSVPAGWTYSFRGTGTNRILNLKKTL